ncbi:hypothetical protein, partial [Novosphingobium sp. KN65.2]|uniref:hypothetical protein n=1 Tax=Novosphingobium sp. KN65.2 TaxID=1478134 RepID=UPI0006D5A8E3
MPAPDITPLPDPPLRSETPATFTAKAEAWVAALVDFVTEINAFGDYWDSYSPSQQYIWSFFFTTTPTDGEVLALHVAGADFTIPADFTAGLQSSIGTNPTS